MNMIEKRKAMAGQGGFTLIELLVVIAILAILAGAAIVGIGAMRASAQKTSCKSERDTLETAAEAYAVDNTGTAGFSKGTVTVTNLKDSGYAKKVVAGNFTLAYQPASDDYKVSATSTGKYADVSTECNS